MLIVLSAPASVKNEVRLINRLFESGLMHFHLRKDGMSKMAYEQIIAKIDPAYYDRLVIHQFHELAFTYPVRRLHYKESHRRKSQNMEFEELNKTGNSLSTSIHDLSHLSGLKNFDYVFYGPVYNSLSKSGYVGLPANKLVLPICTERPKLVALGGIQYSNIKQALELGFDGVAVLGAVWNASDNAIMNFKKMQGKWNRIAL